MRSVNAVTTYMFGQTEAAVDYECCSVVDDLASTSLTQSKRLKEFTQSWLSMFASPPSCGPTPAARRPSRAPATRSPRCSIDLDARHPGLRDRLIKDGALHRFVNVYVNDEDVRFLGSLDAKLNDGDNVTILPAVAGGAFAFAAIAAINGRPVTSGRMPSLRI